ncbi:hypothetical protein RCH10_005229 [Variovorax sp. GrIS 2.14]|uniref:hypothetical protein n=1 Tax=Variovorax sp. GrIS 2.14 TaxID=3071709 RepID=UPI0038F6BB32
METETIDALRQQLLSVSTSTSVSTGPSGVRMKYNFNARAFANTPAQDRHCATRPEQHDTDQVNAFS